MKVLGFDLETTGVDSKTANILEVGAVLYDVNEGFWKAIDMLSVYVFDESYLPLPKDAMAVNGITEDKLRSEGIRLVEAINLLNTFAERCDFTMAHNEQYDNGVLATQLTKYGISSSMLDKKKLCSLQDVEQFVGRKCRKLSHLAVDFGLTVDGNILHGALADVKLMGMLANRLGLNPDTMWEYRSSPTLVLSTSVAKPWEDNGVDAANAKEHGYGWQGAAGKTYLKKWVKAIKKNKLVNEKRPYEILEEL
jgi:DNA polymerase III epsilon subunit-like protein